MNPHRLTAFACLPIAAALLSWSTLAVAQPSQGDSGFYERDAEGWFWYVDPERELEDEEKAKKPPPPPPSTKPQESGPPALSSAWMRENLPKYRDLAIDNPTPDNVAAYFYLQRYMMDKSEKFARVASFVVATDPYLDENTRKPIASFASMGAARTAKEQKDVVLEELASEAGIWFFFHSECPYCEQQAPVLEMLERNYGFTVSAVSLDGKPLPSGRYSNFVTDKGQAAKLGVAATPAMFLVKPPDQVVPIAQGVLSATQIADRAVRVAASAGFITQEQYAATQTARIDMSMDTSMDSARGLTEAAARDTRKLVNYMRSLYGEGVKTPVRPMAKSKGENK